MTVSVAALIAELLDAFNAASSDELQFWTVDDLYAFASEAAREISRKAAIFVEPATVAVTAGEALYANPDRHTALIAFTLDGYRLRPASARQLAAYSDAWELDAGDPDHWIQDYRGHDYFRLYPVPTSDGTLEVILARYPDELTAQADTVTAPAVFGDYLSDRMLAEARRQEGDGEMPEVAEALDREADLLAQVFADYWGTP